jgi:hypothetical protein
MEINVLDANATATHYPVDPQGFYSPADLDEKGLAKKQTLAQWRHEKRGPPYLKVGSRVLYGGKDLIDWLAASRVEPSAF